MPVEISSLTQLLSLVNSAKVIVVDFYATWCGPCKMVAPEFERLSQYYDAAKVVFCKVDVDRVSDAAQRYNVTAMPTFLVFRAGAVVETIRGANIGRLQQVIDSEIRHVPVAFNGTGRSLGGGGGGGHGSSLLSSVPTSSSVSSSPLDAMSNAFCRLQTSLTEADAIAKKDALDNIYTLICKEAPLGIALLPYCLSKSFDPKCLSQVIEYIAVLMPSPQCDDAERIVHSLVLYFNNAFGAMTWSDKSRQGSLHRAFLNLLKAPKAKELVLTASRFHGPAVLHGDGMERYTVLGSMLSVGLTPSRNPTMAVPQLLRQQRIMSLMQQFPLDGANPSSLDRVAADRVIDEIKMQTELFTSLNFAVFRELLADKDCGRVPTLHWIGKMLHTNADFTKTVTDNSRLANQTTMVQFANVLIELALPVVSTSSFDPATIPASYTYDELCSIVNFGKDVERIAHFDKAENPLPSLPSDEEGIKARSYQPRTHLFFAAIRAVGLTSSSMLLKYDQFVRQARHPGMRQQDRHYMLAECAMTKALLSNTQTATKMIRFLNGVAKWLLSLMEVSREGVLPTEVPLNWKTLPQQIVDDVIRGTKLLTTLRVPISAVEIHDIMSLMFVLMGNSAYFPKPHTHALFPPLLISLLQDRASNEALQRHPWFQQHIVKDCILCYIAMEKSEYEKVQTRYELSHCLKAFLQNDSLCQPVRDELESGGSHVLERFSHMVTADVNAAVDQTVTTLQKMNAMVVSGADLNAPPPQPNDNDDESNQNSTPPERSYDQHGEDLKSNLMLFDVCVDVFIEMTAKFPRGIAQNMVAQQISQMLARSLVTFAGSKCRDLVIRNGEKYEFRPRQILTKLVECFVQFRSYDTFIRHLCECGTPLQDIYEAIGAIVHRKLVRDDLCGRLTEMYNKILSTSKDVEGEVALWDDAPDYALDAILSTPLTDPVALPMDVRDVEDLVFTNRQTLHHMLLTEPKHPYTKEYLDEDMVNAFNARPHIVSAVAELKRKIAHWLEEAKRDASRH